MLKNKFLGLIFYLLGLKSLKNKVEFLISLRSKKIALIITFYISFKI